MQSIFRLPWCNEALGPKMGDKAASLEPIRQTPLVEIPMLNKLKRKRADSPDSSSSPRVFPSKKQRSDAVPAPSSPLVAAAPPAEPAVQQGLVPSTEETANAPSLSQAAVSRPDLTGSLQIPQRSDILTQQPVSDKKVYTASSEGPAKSTSHAHDTPLDLGTDSSSSSAVKMSKLQEVIQNQFNMQILLKHDELRLIEQELAKCQVALEQLRRCELKPFPGSNRPSEAVSAGTGPSITPQRGFTRPSYAAPYGVTDGPYTRHYQNWLVHDPQFDSIPERALAHYENGVSAAGRPTRNSGHARHSVSKPAAFGTKSAESMQSIPNYPAMQVKDKSAPLVLKRSTDGQLVKLICNNCQRGNFSSIQGFLNHCRIAHRVEYKSHDEAAIKCGKPLEEGELANLPPATVNTPAPKPTPARSSSTAASTPVFHGVRALNTNLGLSPPMSQPSQQRSQAPLRTPVPSLNTLASPSAESPLTPSATVPRLSAFFAKHQLGGDLAKAVTAAKQEVSFGMDGETSSPDEASFADMAASPLVSHFARGAGGEKNADDERPASRKGFRQPAGQRPRPSPLTTTTAATMTPSASQSAMGVHVPFGDQISNGHVSLHHHHHQDHHEGAISSTPLTSATLSSPHTTDGNHPPGLVSDHDDEEDDAGSASEEEISPPHRHRHHPTAQSQPHVTVHRSCNAAATEAVPMDLVVDGDDEEEAARHHRDPQSGVFIRRNSFRKQ